MVDVRILDNSRLKFIGELNAPLYYSLNDDESYQPIEDWAMSLGVYSAGFVVNVIVDGKMQEVSKDGIISVKFGSEYVIRLQNKNNRRAVAKVFIDDINQCGAGVVIPAYSYADLERPLDKEFRFKFVSTDSGQAADAGKSKNYNGEKGVLRFEFKLEKEYKPYIPPINYNHPYRDEYSKGGFEPFFFNNNVRGKERVDNNTHKTSCSFDESTACDFEPEEREVKTCGGILSKGIRSRGYEPPKQGRDGCTVSGDKSNQKFTSVTIDLEDSSPVVLQVTLKGWDENSLPVFDGKSVYCSGCGKKAVKSTDKFCSRCGNKLD